LYPYYGTPPHPKYEEMRQRYGPDIQDKLDRYFEIRDDQGKTAAKNYISAHPEVAQAFDYLRSQENVPNPNALNLTYDYAWAKPAAAGEVQATAGPFVDIVHRTATKYQVSPADVFAIIHVESRGIADAVNGDSKASGLMQVMPSDALISPESFVNRPTSKDLLDPTVNIEWGTRILKQYLDSSGGDLKQALYKYSGYSGTGDMARFEKEYWEPFLAARADAESVQPSAPSPPGVSVPSVAQAAVPPIEPAPSGAWGTQYQPSSYAARRTYGGGGGGGRRGGWVDYPPRQTASTTEGTMFPWWWWYYHKRPHLGPMHWRW